MREGVFPIRSGGEVGTKVGLRPFAGALFQGGDRITRSRPTLAALISDGSVVSYNPHKPRVNHDARIVGSSVTLRQWPVAALLPGTSSGHRPNRYFSGSPTE